VENPTKGELVSNGNGFEIVNIGSENIGSVYNNIYIFIM